MATATSSHGRTASPSSDVGAGRRWAMLAVSTLAQTASAVALHGPAFLIPVLHTREGLSLATAGLVSAAPMVGVMLTLVAWGVVVDRGGERLALVTGLGVTALAALASTTAHGPVGWCGWLFVAGAAAASANAASGRVVVGWFPAGRRGLAMGIRQMAQPLGVAVAAVTMPVLAEHHGIRVALAVPAAAAALACVAVAVVVKDPPRPRRTVDTARNPYRSDHTLARVHGVSMLLVVPQFLVWTYSLAWLVTDRGWSAASAGALVAVTQVCGALGRIGVGDLSDRVGSRMRPLRWVAVAVVVTMGLLGAAAHEEWGVAVLLLVVASTVTVADNGLAFTAVAERAGPFWSGRALGVQNTGQFLTAAAVPPLAGALVSWTGYAVTFASASVFALVALPLVPVRDEHDLRDR
ncbi:MFS transporter [Phycicoccus sp. Soil802]|uniref:MFS transporter n=1 Tax=Phycicoccus sp. Soil802 TaxID=1736414 RepID=UPI000A73AEBA|nr:MFS transporter [Phycicoccus sp. Soil802]